MAAEIFCVGPYEKESLDEEELNNRVQEAINRDDVHRTKDIQELTKKIKSKKGRSLFGHSLESQLYALLVRVFFHFP
jgi:hypothetical protein